MPDRETLDRLLSGRDRMSVTEKEAMLDALLEKPRRRWQWPALGLVLAAGMAAAVLMVQSNDDFTARGGEQTNMRIGCGDKPCHVGDTLRIEVTPSKSLRYFAAFGEPASGGVIWYFGDSIAVEHAGWLDQGVVLDHGAGSLRVTGVFSDAPLDREAIKAGKGHIVERSIEVLP